MNSTALEQFETIEQLQKRNPFFGVGVDFDPIKELIEETHRREKLEELKLAELRADIGDKLFSQLSEEDKRFFLETEGVLDFGYELTEKDLKRISKYIEEYED